MLPQAWRARNAFVRAFNADNTSPTVAGQLPLMTARYGKAADLYARAISLVQTIAGAATPPAAPALIPMYENVGRLTIKKARRYTGAGLVAELGAIRDLFVARGLTEPAILAIFLALTGATVPAAP